MDEEDEAEAHAEALEAAEEGDVRMLSRCTCMLILCCKFRLHMQRRTATSEQSRKKRRIGCGMIARKVRQVGCMRREL